MTEIIKAPTLPEATQYNDNIVKMDIENTDAFCADVIEQINDYIKGHNWFLSPSRTVEIRWDWWREKWKGKMSQQGIYKYAIPILKKKIEEAGYALFYSGGGDRVAYFTMKPFGFENISGLAMSE